MSWWATASSERSSCSRRCRARDGALFELAQLVLEVVRATCAAAEVRLTCSSLRCGCLRGEATRSLLCPHRRARPRVRCVEKSARPQRGRCQRLVNARDEIGIRNRMRVDELPPGARPRALHGAYSRTRPPNGRRVACHAPDGAAELVAAHDAPALSTIASRSSNSLTDSVSACPLASTSPRTPDLEILDQDAFIIACSTIARPAFLACGLRGLRCGDGAVKKS